MPRKALAKQAVRSLYDDTRNAVQRERDDDSRTVHFYPVSHPAVSVLTTHRSAHVIDATHVFRRAAERRTRDPVPTG